MLLTMFNKEYFSSFGKWDEIKHYFDENGDDAIEPHEFVKGFARMAMVSTWNIPSGGLDSD